MINREMMITINNSPEMLNVIDTYMENNKRKLRNLCHKIWHTKKIDMCDYDDLYDVAMECLMESVVQFDNKKSGFETFLSGNISNMRVPCAGMAQVAADVEPGTEKGSIVSVIGMATSIVINVSVLTIGVILGSSVLSAMPASVIEALNYLLPALFGALLMQFGLKRIKFAGGMLAFAILIGIAINAGLFNWLPGAANYLTTLASVFAAIGVTLATYGKKKEAGK